MEYCGDGEAQYPRGEACDDGNREDGDGCSRYCRSETCGNGQVEEPFEECDDGNFQSHDGCSSGCTREYLWWDDQVAMSEGRFGHAATWDESRQHLVIFGGSDGTILRDDVLETRWAGAVNTDHGEIWLTGGFDQTDFLFSAALRLVHRSLWPDEEFCNQTLDRDHDGLAGSEDPDCQESRDCL